MTAGPTDRGTWYLHRVDRLEPDTSGWSAQERGTVHVLRWWTMAEMTATSDLLVPRALATLLPPLLVDAAAGRLPATPRRVGP